MNNFLLARDKFKSEMYLKQLWIKYSTCGSFMKNKERIQNFNGTGDSRYIYQKELNEACFQHDMAYGDFKDLTQGPTSSKILLITLFNIAKNPKHDGYQSGLSSMVYKIFGKKKHLVKQSKMILCLIKN